MIEHNDPLWDPAAAPDADSARMERLLGPLGARAKGLHPPTIPTRVRSRPPRLRWALAASIALLMLAGGFGYRLQWRDGAAWTIAGETVAPDTSRHLAPGEAIETGKAETLRIEVARIGSITLSPQSQVRLLHTRTGDHRVSLQEGHLRARIWAPPGYFGVVAGAAEVIDLGCDFDVWQRRDGSGRVFVRNGWVNYRVGPEEVLIPGGYGLTFEAARAATPLRPDASIAMVRAVHDLDAALVHTDPRDPAVDSLAQAVASAARDRDAYTLLSLLTRQPDLARTPLYPRLATALGVTDAAPGHRRAWQAGELQAINRWWARLPRQPKQWFRNWSDVIARA